MGSYIEKVCLGEKSEYIVIHSEKTWTKDFDLGGKNFPPPPLFRIIHETQVVYGGGLNVVIGC